MLLLTEKKRKKLSLALNIIYHSNVPYLQAVNRDDYMECKKILKCIKKGKK